MTERIWRCGVCGHAETVDHDGLAGEVYEQTREGSLGKTRTVKLARCPECGNDDWRADEMRSAEGKALSSANREASR